MSGITISPNAGVPSQPVTDSSTTRILDALKAATSCNVVIINLEEGQAWWETRLLVLLAGAERLKRPQKVVFVGTDGGKREQFQGWAHPDELLQCLGRHDEQYQRSVLTARAAGRQWELVEPLHRLPGLPVQMPVVPPWMTPGLATRHPWMAFDPSTGLPNDLLAEQLLAADLGEKVESETNPRSISLERLRALFRPVLIKERLDQCWSPSRQMETFFSLSTQFIAMTNNNKYITMISKLGKV